MFEHLVFFDVQINLMIPVFLAESVEQAWEAATLRTPSMELTGHTGVVVAADWMMEGNQVITASWDRTAILFDAETGDQITCLTGKWKIIYT